MGYKPRESHSHTDVGNLAASIALVLAGAGFWNGAALAETQPAASAGGLDEIIVTARKREERLQDVPLAVTAFDPAMLQKEQIVNLSNFNFAVPSVTISSPQGSQNGAAVFIRGIGQDNSTILNENGVGVYLDGVYLARQVGSMIDLLDVDRVEVLRGPQGTLYGRNNLGGAIKFEMRRPSTDAFSYQADATVGSFERVDLRGVANLPLSETAAVSVSALSRSDNGYYTNAITGADLNRKDTQVARAAFLWNASSDVTLYLSADFTRDHSGLQVGTPFTSADPSVARPVYGDYFKSAPALPDLNRYSGWGTQATLEWNTSIGKFSSITAYRKINYVQADDLSAVPYASAFSTDWPFPTLKLTRTLDHHQLTEELQFNSSWAGPFSLTGGLYYFREEGHENLGFIIGGDPSGNPISLPFLADQVSKSVAAYAEGTWKFNDQWSATVGGRYTKDNKDLVRGGILAGLSASDSGNHFTPRGILSFTPTRDTLLYASVSKGYQEGEFQPFPSDVPSAITITDPQYAKAFEAGAKTEWLDHHLRANLSVFRNDYTNLAIGIKGNGTLVEQTSADVRVQGAELELSLRATDRLSLSGYLAKVDSKYTRAPGGANNPQVGDEQKNTPPFTGRVSADYTVPVSARGNVVLGGVYTYSDKYYPLVPNLPWYLQKAYGLLDLRAGYTDTQNHWTVEAGGKNLGDERYFQQATLLSGPLKFFMPGRTWYLQLRVASH